MSRSIADTAICSKPLRGSLGTESGGASDGQSPEAPMIFDTAGNLYGTTRYGGSGGGGTVFRWP